MGNDLKRFESRSQSGGPRAVRITAVLAFLLLTLVFYGGPAYASDNLSDGLVLYLPFDDTAEDMSGNGNDGILNGTPSYVDGYRGSAIHFEGIDAAVQQYVHVANSASLQFDQEMTISYYIRMTTDRGMDGNGIAVDHGIHCMFSKNLQGSLFNYYQTSSDGGGIGNNAGAGQPYYLRYTTDLAIGQWVNVTYVVTETKTSVYIGGSLAAEKVLTSPFDFASANANDLYIGSLGGTKWYPLYGDIDEFRIYNRALSPNEIMGLVRIDTPVVLSVTSPVSNGSYTFGDTIPIQVVFNRLVNVTGQPELTLNTGAAAGYVSGSGTSVLVFDYVIGPGDSTDDLDYTGTDALTLNSGTIAGAGDGAAAELQLPLNATLQSLGGNKDIAIERLICTIQFDSRCGTDIPDAYAEYGRVIDPPEEPSMTGFVFGGWYKDPDCLSPWDFAVDTVTEDIVLHAKWTELTLSSSDTDAKLYTGGRITLTPSVDGGTWDWDEEYLSATFNSPATFTALKAGKSTITYTVEGVSATYDVTIEESELPTTGQDFTWMIVSAGCAALAAAAAFKIRKGTAVR